MLSKILPVFHSNCFEQQSKEVKRSVQKRQTVKTDSVHISQIAQIMNENKQAAKSTIDLM